MTAFDPADPLHMESAPDRAWTMTNVAEAIPGCTDDRFSVVAPVGG